MMTIDVSKIKPLRPYLVRAHYEWLVDNGLTPYIMVDTTYPGTEVPFELAKNGGIVFNISMNALDSLNLGNDFITFNASFSGRPSHIIIPLGAIVSIYAKENNMGVRLPEESYYENERQVLEAKQSLQVLNDHNESENENLNENLKPSVAAKKRNQEDAPLETELPLTEQGQKGKDAKKASKKATKKTNQETLAKKTSKPKKASHLRVLD